jgi:acyl transferase domain-containing protein
VAGLFSLADAATLITARARLMDSARAHGWMVSVGAGTDAVAPLLAGYPDVAIAAINAPQQCVISGGRDSMAAITAELTARELAFRRLPVSLAFHSPLMTEPAADLREALDGVQFTEPAITLVSTMSGQVARRSDFSADYWARHIVEPVNFMAAMRALDRRGKHLFIEIGPAATLTPLGKRCVPAGRHVWLPSIRPSDKDGDVVDAVARAYAAGQPISWPDFHQGHRGRRIELPAYAFDRRSYRLPVAPVDRPPAIPADGASNGQGVKAGQAATGRTAENGVVEEASRTALEGGERRTAITALIREKVAEVLEFTELSDVEADIDFTDLGMDSLLAVRLRKELCASLSISFATPEIFNNPTPLALAEFLDGCLEKVG